MLTHPPKDLILLVNSIGPYTVVERIASGGMGEIYVAKLQREAGFEKLVAVKRILPHLAHDEGFVRMFEAEARLSALLTHRNIVQVYDFGRSDNETYLAMEFVDGFNVRALQDMGRKQGIDLPVPISARIVASTARALDYAYRRHDVDGQSLHIIHRDISPQNILVSVEGEVKVADFGLAKALQIDATSLSGELKGKLNYMSPEQVRGHALDFRADMFALGAVFYELLTGKRLYPANVAIRTLIGMVERAEFEPIRECVASVPEALAHIVTKCLQPEAANRYESTRALVQALDEAINELGIGEPTYTLADYVRRFDSERPLARIVAHEVTLVPERPIVNRGDADPSLTVSANNPIPKTERAMLKPQQPESRSVISMVDTQSVVDRSSPKRSLLPLLAVTLLLAVGAVAWIQYAQSGNDEPNPAPQPAVTVSSSETEQTQPPVIAEAEKKNDKGVLSNMQSLVLKGAPNTAECIVFDQLREAELPSQSCNDPWSVQSGMYRILISADGYANWNKTVRVLPGVPLEVVVQLKAKPPEPCDIHVSTEPSGANIWVDNVIQNGSTPLNLKALVPGKHAIRASLRGHSNVEQIVVCDRSTSKNLNIRMQPVTYRVSVNNVERVLREGATWTYEKKLAGIQTTFRVVVRKKFALVTINTKPYSRVGVGKRDLGVVPVKFRVPRGATRRVRLSRMQRLLGTLKLRFEQVGVPAGPLP